MRIPEEFIHYVWQFKLFDKRDLQTVEGKNLQINQVGLWNKNSGPDFTNAKIQIDDTLWVGQVEIHLQSSDWNTHRHQEDEAYNNVVLHVVLKHDTDVYTKEGQLLPTLVLENRISNSLFANYERLICSTTTFPCQNQLSSVDSFVVDSFLSRVLIERFEHKSAAVFELLSQLNGHWDETFYQFVARNFGFKINAVPMQLLAASLPQNLFAKHKDKALQIEALLFGQAGFLKNDLEDDYPKKLRQEYDFLKQKYQLQPLDVSLWKFMRMRPQNFPTRRLAQFAALITKSSYLFSKILEIENIAELRNLFEDLQINSFWETHYHFAKKCNPTKTNLGKSSVDNLLMNTVALFLFAYGKYTDQEHFQQRAFAILETIPSEQNAIITAYQEAGLKVKSAFQSQAILQLNKQYCQTKQCLNCGIGMKILNRTVQ